MRLPAVLSRSPRRSAHRRRLTPATVGVVVLGLATSGLSVVALPAAPVAADAAPTASAPAPRAKVSAPPRTFGPKTGFVAGKSVEDVSKRTEQTETFDNPDGTRTLQIPTELDSAKARTTHQTPDGPTSRTP